MAYKLDAGQQWLRDTTSNELVGIKDSVDGEERFLVFSETNPVTGGIELSGGVDDLIIKALYGVGVARKDMQFANGQPYGISRPSREMGRLIGSFDNAALWTLSAGTPVLSNVTGYDGSGNKSAGVPQSRTGMPSMLKVVPNASGDAIILPPANMAPTVCNGKLGLWVYIDSMTGYGGGETLGTAGIALYVGTTTGGSYASTSQFYFNQNQLREGWNFLKAVKETNPTANGSYSGDGFTADVGGRDAHFIGTSEISYNVGTWGSILAADITCVKIEMYGFAGKTLYFDSLWGDFTSKAQVCIGTDSTHPSLPDMALPIFTDYGWVGYVASPRLVANPSVFGLPKDWRTLPSDGSSLRYGMSAYESGWDFLNHTVNHNALGGYTSDAQIASEILLVDAWYKAQGIVRGTEFYASPQSSSSRLSEKVIAGCGIKVQRHARKSNTSVTPWGVDNLNHIGSIDMGNRSNWQKASKLKAHIDLLIRYGDTGHMFWHQLTTTNDDYTGEALGPDDLYIPYTNFKNVMEYVREKELAGVLTVCRGMSGFYYGF